ncbi:M48 family metallopeptidase [Flavobacterium sp. J27]|uniref:M48 family metallopeptidase n=1 Tax=Flavobacterium sp. J27 TaxID=2060419 RepID=UPI00103009FC|nr:M48 family metallopeptidase [Flavobacterium sp. J27]
MNASIVTPKPVNPPKELTKLSQAYIVKATIAILSILLFFVLYTSLIIALFYLVYVAITYEVGSINKLTILIKLGAIAGSVMLALFTLKFIFKLKNHKPDNRIKLDKKENEELFSFIDDICKSTGAPKPKNIYVDPDVNAYVSYTNVWLSLFLPTKKELTIGLGLVSSLNLSEFKAVVAHEFGHFAQRSMKIGSYIHSANTIIHGMIFSRDKWDEILEQWRGSDIRLSFAAWIITPVIWVIRQLLMLFYMLLNRMHSLLSQEMEFNADKVAVKVAGSDAIVSALWRLEHGFTNWNTIVSNAFHASKKEVYSKNLYHHKGIALEKQKENFTTILNDLPVDHNGSKVFFSISENAKVSMYASHPPNALREKSAKSPFLGCEIDTRSPWILFSNKLLLQEKLTQLVYEKYLQKKPTQFVEEIDFQQFIEAESVENSLFEEYENTFQNRFITIPSIAKIDLLDTISTSLDDLKKEVAILMLPVKDIENLLQKANEIASGTTKEKKLVYKDKVYTKKDIQIVYDILIADREALFFSSFTAWDEKFIGYFYQLAKQKQQSEVLIKRYEQHQKIIALFQFLLASKNEMLTKISQLQSIGEVTQTMVDNLANDIKDKVKHINAELMQFYTIDFIPLPNIETVAELKNALFDGGQLIEEKGRIFENNGINRIITAIDNGIVSCNRIENKSLEQILKTHKELLQN